MQLLPTLPLSEAGDVVERLDVRCSIDAPDAVSLVDALPATSDAAAPSTQIADVVRWHLESTSDRDLEVLVLHDLDDARFAAMQELAALADSVDATHVRIDSSADRLDIAAWIDADDAGIGDEMFAVMQPLELTTITVALSDAADAEGDFLVFLEE